MCWRRRSSRSSSASPAVSCRLRAPRSTPQFSQIRIASHGAAPSLWRCTSARACMFVLRSGAAQSRGRRARARDSRFVRSMRFSAQFASLQIPASAEFSGPCTVFVAVSAPGPRQACAFRARLPGWVRSQVLHRSGRVALLRWKTCRNIKRFLSTPVFFRFFSIGDSKLLNCKYEVS